MTHIAGTPRLPDDFSVRSSQGQPIRPFSPAGSSVQRSLPAPSLSRPGAGPLPRRGPRRGRGDAAAAAAAASPHRRPLRAGGAAAQPAPPPGPPHRPRTHRAAPDAH